MHVLLVLLPQRVLPEQLLGAGTASAAAAKDKHALTLAQRRQRALRSHKQYAVRLEGVSHTQAHKCAH